jgi:hypothetical protein
MIGVVKLRTSCVVIGLLWKAFSETAPVLSRASIATHLLRILQSPWSRPARLFSCERPQ